MRKTICLVVVLMCAWVSSFGQSNGLPQWKVIREFHVIGANTAIEPTILFTPSKDGMYRVSGVMAAHSQVKQGGGFEMVIRWTNRNSNSDQVGMSFCFSESCGLDDQSINGRVFSAKPQTPVVLSLIVSDPPPQDATYDLAFTIEKLTH